MHFVNSLCDFGRSFFGGAPSAAVQPVSEQESVPVPAPVSSEEAHSIPAPSIAAHEEGAAPAAAAAAISPAVSIEDGLQKLKVEQLLRIQEKADRLHQESIAVNAKIRNIDAFLGLIQEHCAATPQAPFDCTRADVQAAAEVLRADGVRIPLPASRIEVAQIGGMFTVLGNQRGVFADDLKEKVSGYQQCVSNHDAFLQQIMALLNELSRAKSKIITNIHG